MYQIPNIPTSTYTNGGAGEINPLNEGVKWDGTTDDAGALNTLAAAIETEYAGSNDWPTLTLPAGKARIESRVEFPEELSIRGLGANNSEFLCIGADAGVSIGEYDPTGQLTGTVPNGGQVGGFRCQGDGTQTGPMINVGYLGAGNVFDIWARGGGPASTGIRISETQDSILDSLRANLCGVGIEMNHGASNNRIGAKFATANTTAQIKIGSDDTTSSGAVSGAGPSRNLFFDCGLDFFDGGADGIVIESGRGNTFAFGRVSREASNLPDEPLIRVNAPTGGANAQTYTEFFRVQLRASAAADAYVLEQAASSGDPVRFTNCPLENLDAYPLFRTPAGAEFDNGYIATLPPNHSDLGSIEWPQHADIRFAWDSIGPVLRDRTDGTQWRLLINGGVLSAEAI